MTLFFAFHTDQLWHSTYCMAQLDAIKFLVQGHSTKASRSWPQLPQFKTTVAALFPPKLTLKPKAYFPAKPKLKIVEISTLFLKKIPEKILSFTSAVFCSALIGAKRKGVFGCGKGQPQGRLSSTAGSELVARLVGVNTVPVCSFDANQTDWGWKVKHKWDEGMERKDIQCSVLGKGVLEGMKAAGTVEGNMRNNVINIRLVAVK